MDERVIKRLNWRCWQEPIDATMVALCCQADRPSTRGGTPMCKRATAFLIVPADIARRGGWQNRVAQRLIQICDETNFGQVPWVYRAAMDGPVGSWLP
jgi:hypothetical protein